MKLKKKNFAILLSSIFVLGIATSLIINVNHIETKTEKYEKKEIRHEENKAPKKTNNVEEKKLNIENPEKNIPEEKVESKQEEKNEEIEPPKSNKGKEEKVIKKEEVIKPQKQEEIKQAEQKNTITTNRIYFANGFYKTVVNNQVSLSVITEPSNSTDKEIIYSTNRPDLIEIDENGRVTAKKASLDKALVYAKLKSNPDISAYTQVRIYENVEAQSIIFPQKSITYDMGTNKIEKLKANVKLKPTSSNNYTYTGVYIDYTSSNPEVATVQNDDNSLLILKSVGTTTITAKTFNGLTAEMKVTVVNNESPKVAPIVKVKTEDNETTVTYGENEETIYDNSQYINIETNTRDVTFNISRPNSNDSSDIEKYTYSFKSFIRTSRDFSEPLQIHMEEDEERYTFFTVGYNGKTSRKSITVVLKYIGE